MDGRFDGSLRGAIHRTRPEHLVRRPGWIPRRTPGRPDDARRALVSPEHRPRRRRDCAEPERGVPDPPRRHDPARRVPRLALVVLFYIGYSAWLSAHQMPAEA